jgi:cytochrome c oxidase subunit 2
MEEDMNGFRIWTAVDNRLPHHIKRLIPYGAKAASALLWTVPLLLSMTGCGKRTPTYSGPPDTVLSITMKKWEITPSRIQVPQGARVELVVSTADIEHGLGVPGLGINEPVQPGKPAVVRFLAETPGVYPMRCSILCGRGHDQMTGVIVIEANTGVPSGGGG